MTISHTPGPWTLDAPICKSVVSETYHIIDAGHGFLDRKAMQGFSVTGHMTLADARLITASPRLYDACNGLLGLLQLLDNRDDIPREVKNVMRDNHRVVEALAAVREAEGDTP